MPNIFITDISSYKGIVFAQSLSKIKGANVFTGDSRSYTKNIRTKNAPNHIIYTSPKKDKEKFLNEIISIVNNNNIDFLVPVNSEEIRVLLRAKEKMNGALDYMGEYETFMLLDDKKNLSSLVKQLGIPVPLDYRLEDDINSFPLVYKPTQSSSSKGVRYINSKEELMMIRNENSKVEYVLQDYIQGEGVGYSVFASNGNIITACGHKRLAEFPVSGGSSTVRAYFEHPEMERIAKKILEHTKWSGYAMFEFKLTPQDEIYMIEINPRVWGSMNQSISVGIDFPAALLGYINNKNLNKKAITYLSPLHFMSMIGYVLKYLRLKKTVNLLLNSIVGKPDVSIWKDPKGYFSVLLRSLA